MQEEVLAIRSVVSALSGKSAFSEDANKSDKNKRGDSHHARAQPAPNSQKMCKLKVNRCEKMEAILANTEPLPPAVASTKNTIPEKLPLEGHHEVEAIKRAGEEEDKNELIEPRVAEAAKVIRRMNREEVMVMNI